MRYLFPILLLCGSALGQTVIPLGLGGQSFGNVGSTVGIDPCSDTDEDAMWVQPPRVIDNADQFTLQVNGGISSLPGSSQTVWAVFPFPRDVGDLRAILVSPNFDTTPTSVFGGQLIGVDPFAPETIVLDCVPTVPGDVQNYFWMDFPPDFIDTVLYMQAVEFDGPTGQVTVSDCFRLGFIDVTDPTPVCAMPG